MVKWPFGKKEPSKEAKSEFSSPFDLGDVTASTAIPRTVIGLNNGDKFSGGFGDTKLLLDDYWTLRARSEQLFNENLYARGIINRLVTNEVNTGLTPECTPCEHVIGVDDYSLADWTDITEDRFAIWASDPQLCDYYGADTFNSLQAKIRTESLIGGDCLVILRTPDEGGSPQIQVVRGSAVKSPINSERAAKKIIDGVEIVDGRHVAYHIEDSEGKLQRVEARSKKTGRRLAWLVYGVPTRVGQVRGKPLLSIVLQSLKEIDRYRDSTQRSAALSSTITAFITKQLGAESTARSLTTSGADTLGAKRRTALPVTEHEENKNFTQVEFKAGTIIDNLAAGETLQFAGGDGTDVNFGEFEATIVSAVAWALQIPPEILTMSFTNNYSASQAAINEFKIYLNWFWSFFGQQFCQPVFSDWLASEVLEGRIEADGLVKAVATKDRITIAAWTSAEWLGSIKPSTDMYKQTRGSEAAVQNGWSTNARESRVITGTKYGTNVKRLKREIEQRIEAFRPLAEFKAEYGQSLDDVAKEATALADLEEAVAQMAEAIDNVK